MDARRRARPSLPSSTRYTTCRCSVRRIEGLGTASCGRASGTFVGDVAIWVVTIILFRSPTPLSTIRYKSLHIAGSASKRYKVFSIPKRNGGKRTIAQPSKALKSVQRWLNSVLISQLPVHHCAMAYRKGINIRMNALRHADTAFTLRMDFCDFFPSFSICQIRRFVEEKNRELDWQLSADDVEFFCAIATRNGFLTIGAPLSPSLTNAIMFEFDRRVHSIAMRHAMVYTRYADDLFISARKPNELGKIEGSVQEIGDGFRYASLRINRRKTAYLSRRYRRAITGLVISPEGQVSIGRKRKREIRGLVHRYLVGSLGDEELERVRGLVAFSKDAEPTFFEALGRKYDVKTLVDILRQGG